MLVSDIMSRDLLTAPVALTVADALSRAEGRDVHHLLVVENRRLKGVMCVCDLRRRPADTPLRACIDHVPTLICAESTLEQALARFLATSLSFLPVCDGDELVGVITRGDLSRSLGEGAALPAGFRCRFCGSTRHVRPYRGDSTLPVCFDCQDRAASTTRRWFGGPSEC